MRNLSGNLVCGSSVEHAGEFLAKSAKDPALSEVDSIDRNTELGCHIGGFATADHVFPASTPGCRLELGLHQLKRANSELLLEFGLGERQNFVVAARYLIGS